MAGVAKMRVQRAGVTAVFGGLPNVVVCLLGVEQPRTPALKVITLDEDANPLLAEQWSET